MLRIYKGIEIFHLRQEVIINILLQSLNMLFYTCPLAEQSVEPAAWKNISSLLFHQSAHARVSLGIPGFFLLTAPKLVLLEYLRMA